MLVAEDLIDVYLSGDLEMVRTKLAKAPPLVAAIVAVDLYRMVRAAGVATNPKAHVFVDLLRGWAG